MSDSTATNRVPPHAEVRGGCVLALLAAMGPFRTRAEQILAESGIHSWNTEWVPLAAYLRALRTVAAGFGASMLEQIGRQTPHHVVLPARVEGFAGMLAALAGAYRMNHRGVGDDAIRYRLTGEGAATLITCSPYPAAFQRGVIQGCFELLLGTSPELGDEGALRAGANGGRERIYRVTLPLHTAGA